MTAILDENDWFILISALLSNSLVVFLPPLLTRWQTFLIWLLNFYFATIIDHLIAGRQYDMYDTMDDKKFEFLDVFIYLLLYPSTAYLVLYAYEKFRPRGAKLMGFLLLCAGVTYGLEWIASKFNVYQYHGWKHIYSLPFYYLVWVINIWFFRWITKLAAKGAADERSTAHNR